MVVSVHPVVLTTSLMKVTVGAPQASDTITVETSGAGTDGLHPVRVTFAGQVITGGVLSTVLVKVWAQVDVLPQASAA